MLLQSRQKMEFSVLDSQNLLTEVLFDPVHYALCISVNLLFPEDEFYNLQKRNSIIARRLAADLLDASR